MKLKESCGLFGVWGDPDAVRLTYFGLYSLQHRGQESAGIASIQNGKIVSHKAMGLVGEVFKKDIIDQLKSHAAIGHVRYSTTGHSDITNAQPLVVDSPLCMIAIAHNGNLVNSKAIRQNLEKQGQFFPIFHTTTDTEIILYLIARYPKEKLQSALKRALQEVKGAYSLLFLTPDYMIAARDPNAFRPLSLARKQNAYAIASETCAFEMIGFECVRDIEPGEIVYINGNGLKTDKILSAKDRRPSFCMFEHIYFARPDSLVNNDQVHMVRKKLGAMLAKEYPLKADVVTAVPDSGNAAAIGFAEASGIPFEMCFVRNHYVGRTFIQPFSDQREMNVKIKISVVKDVVKGKRIVVVDDSIIRGTTSRSRLKLLRDAGAREIHLRISCPPTRFPCFYGIDFPTKTELIAANYSVEEIRKFIGADSLVYLSLDRMLSCVSNHKESYCTACWTGEYKVPLIDEASKLKLESR